MLLSIIIPVYNVENYVAQTLESIFCTTASPDDFEVIVINDGTKDGSMDVVRRFVDRPNLTILEQENQGVSVARMAGLSVARGEFVFCVDSDDYLLDDGVSVILTLLRKRLDIDVLVFPIFRSYREASQNKVDLPFKDELRLSGHDYLKNTWISTPPFRFVVKRSVRENRWLFFPKGLLHEDIYWGVVLLYLADIVSIMPQPVYVYRQRSGSIMDTISIRSSYDLVAIYRLTMQFMNEAVDKEDWIWFRRYCFRILKWSYTINEHRYSTLEFRRFIHVNGLFVWREWNESIPDVSWKRMIRRLFFCLTPRLYGRFFKTSVI